MPAGMFAPEAFVTTGCGRAQRGREQLGRRGLAVRRRHEDDAATRDEHRECVGTRDSDDAAADDEAVTAAQRLREAAGDSAKADCGPQPKGAQLAHRFAVDE